MIHGYLDTLEPEESDEEDDPDPLRSFVLDKALSSGALPASEPSVVIICSTGAASAFLREAVALGKQLPWSLHESGDSDKYRFPPCPKSPRFFCPEGVDTCVVVMLEEPVGAEISYAWTAALFEGLGGCPTVVFLDTLLCSAWKSLDDRPRPQEPSLFSLWTSSWKAQQSTQSLTQLPIPNVVEGICAATLTRCEMRGQQCLVALALQDGVHAGSRTLEAFSGLRTVFSQVGSGMELAAHLDYKAMEKGVREAGGLSIYA